ncbi:MAG: hypothetical protein HZB61_10370 [Nitrospirae bacterium]|nr:hypothetical protein [Nitrospirota bacterium]
MSCEKCKEALLIDEVEPPCFKSQCWIPQPDERGQFIFAIRDKLIRLQGLVDPGTILRLYSADIEDIEMLAFLEDEIKKMQNENIPTPGENNG